MEILTKTADVMERVQAAKNAGKRIGIAPAVGSQHDGTLPYLRQAAAQVDLLIVLAQQDAPEMIDMPGQVLWCPTEQVENIGTSLLKINMSQLTEMLLLTSAPAGVEQRLLVLLSCTTAVMPDSVYFEAQHFELAHLLRQCMRDLSLPVRVKLTPAARAPDGVMLTRITPYLSPDQRQAASQLSRALDQTEEALQSGERSLQRLHARVIAALTEWPDADLRYCDFFDPGSLKRIHTWRPRVGIVSLLSFGQVRIRDVRFVDASSAQTEKTYTRSHRRSHRSV